MVFFFIGHFLWLHVDMFHKHRLISELKIILFIPRLFKLDVLCTDILPSKIFVSLGILYLTVSFCIPVFLCMYFVLSVEFDMSYKY